MSVHLFVSDDEIAAIERACEASGAGSTVALEVVCMLDEARTAEELCKLLLSGLAAPEIRDGGALKWCLSQRAKDALANKASARILGELAAARAVAP